MVCERKDTFYLEQNKTILAFSHRQLITSFIILKINY